MFIFFIAYIILIITELIKIKFEKWNLQKFNFNDCNKIKTNEWKNSSIIITTKRMKCNIFLYMNFFIK